MRILIHVTLLLLLFTPYLLCLTFTPNRYPHPHTPYSLLPTPYNLPPPPVQTCRNHCAHSEDPIVQLIGFCGYDALNNVTRRLTKAEQYPDHPQTLQHQEKTEKYTCIVLFALLNCRSCLCFLHWISLQALQGV